MARLAGKVAFITGAARGQGRSHAVRLADEGADIIAVDMAAHTDTDQTVREVEALDRRIVADQADVRDYDGLKSVLDDGVARLGRLDIVVANAGIVSLGTAEELTEQAWQDVMDVNLTGVWHTVKAAIPHLRAAGGGSIIIIGSGLKGKPNLGHYAAAQHRVVGLMQSLANELAPDMIRVNSVHPSAVDNNMITTRRCITSSCPTATATSPGRKSNRYSRRSTRFPSPGSSRWTSPTPRCSSPPTRPATSPAPPCPSTPAHPSNDAPPSTNTPERSHNHANRETSPATA